VGALLRGVAVHHAGCLPGWTTLVEKLFQQGLLKVGRAGLVLRLPDGAAANVMVQLL
jgi:superfamily II RNA helicase